VIRFEGKDEAQKDGSFGSGILDELCVGREWGLYIILGGCAPVCEPRNAYWVGV
jgi:hypothetical protein